MKELIIGIVQGLTEFLPVSSSAHIAILEHYFGIFSKDLSREVALHLATLLAVLIYFRVRLWRLIIDWVKGKSLGYLLYLTLGSIPAGIIGLFFESKVEQAFSSLFLIGILLIINGFVILSSYWAANRKRPVNWLDSILIGVAQACAIFPGISRSGSTITTGLHLGVEPQEAFTFSFLLSVPAILGAGLLEIRKVGIASLSSHWHGALAAFIVGYFALILLDRIIKKGKLYIFAPYLFLLGLLIIILGG